MRHCTRYVNRPIIRMPFASTHLRKGGARSVKWWVQCTYRRAWLGRGDRTHWKAMPSPVLNAFVTTKLLPKHMMEMPAQR